MSMKRLFRMAAAMTLFLFIAGCGSGNSNTNGKLDLTAAAPPTGVGTVALTASATLTPAQVGAKVTFKATQYGYDKVSGTNVTIDTYPIDVPTDKSGIAIMSHTFQQSQTMATAILVEATSSGLFAVPLTIPVPMYTPPTTP